jgi:glycosyltransferase involved in cell wall biosynthesis
VSEILWAATFFEYRSNSLRHPTISPAANGLAKAVNTVVADPETAEGYSQAGRQCCSGEFFWAHIAEQTAFDSTGISS